MERVKSSFFIIPLFFFIFCSSQQNGNIDDAVKEGLKNINQPNSIFFKEIKTKKKLTDIEDIGIYQIIRTNKKYKHPYLLFYKKNDYSIQDAEDVKNSILKIIEFTDNNKDVSILKEYITAYLDIVNISEKNRFNIKTEATQ